MQISWARTPLALRVDDPALSQSKKLRPRAPSPILRPLLVSLQATLFALIFFHLTLLPCLALRDEEIQKFQTLLIDRPAGEKIAFWAEKFIGVPYDRDPLGEYVSRATIVLDERVDCMYLTFRTVELALSRTPEEAVRVALAKRFHSKGVLKEGRVVNYDDRFQYGEDMIESGKWGKEITSAVGRVIRIRGTRGKDFVDVLPPDELKRAVESLRKGDLLFFAKAPEKREVDEIIGHIGIVEVAEVQGSPGSKEIFLIHASGTKRKGGAVKKVLLKDYLSRMPFVGVKVTRFE